MSAKTGSRTPLGSRPSQTLPVRPATKRPPRDQKPQLDSPHADNKPLSSRFLIATPRLEFPVTHTKLSPLTFSNRDYMRVLHPPWRTAVFQISPSRRRSENRPKPLHHVTPGLPTRNAGVPPALLTSGRASRTAGIPAGAFAVSALSTHLAAVAETPRGFSPFTNHKSPVTSHDLLIYGPAIRNPRKP
jgi:hypothetical protein